MKLIQRLFIASALFLVKGNIIAQNNVGIGITTPDPKAALHIVGTGKGIIIPRITVTNRLALLPTAPLGLIVNQTDGVYGLYHYTEFYGWRPVSELHYSGGGWRLASKNPANYGPLGLDAVDFSTSPSPGTTMGARGSNSVAFGYNTMAVGGNSAVFGAISSTIGENSAAFGRAVTAKAASSFVIGEFNDPNDNPSPVTASPNDRLFQIGNGDYATSTFNNALTVLRNGRVGIGTLLPASLLHLNQGALLATAPGNVVLAHLSQYAPPVQGSGRRLLWHPERAAFRVGYVDGTQWDALNMGYYSFAAGASTKAFGQYSTAFGLRNAAESFCSFSIGVDNVVTGDAASALGEGLTAKARGAFATGIMNDQTDNPSPVTRQPTDRIFQVGNGSLPSTFSNALTLLRNGNLGLGVLAPAEKLHVSGGNARIEGVVQLGTTPGINGVEFAYGLAGKQSDAGKICYGCFGDPAHWLGIVGGGLQANGGSDRVIKLWSEGGLRIKGHALPNTDNGHSLGQSGLRWSSVWAVNGTINTSDANLKTNITTSPYGLSEVMQMNPVQYNWKTNPKEDLQIGFLAQDIQKIIPEAVVVPENGDPLGMKYTELIPVLVKAIQEQQKRIEELEKIVKKLQK
jgi:hypothetical protein